MYYYDKGRSWALNKCKDLNRNQLCTLFNACKRKMELVLLNRDSRNPDYCEDQEMFRDGALKEIDEHIWMKDHPTSSLVGYHLEIGR